MVMAGLKMYPGNKNDVHPFACAGPGFGADQGTFPATNYPANHDWKITNAPNVWKAGESTCQSEFGSAYHFWTPGTGIEYGTLATKAAATFETGPFWVNYFSGPVLTGMPNALTIKWNKAQPLPARQQMILRGGTGGALHALAGEAANSQPFFSTSNIAMVNPNTVSVTINPTLASSLAPGSYTQTLQIDETDPARDKSTPLISPLPCNSQIPCSSPETETLIASWDTLAWILFEEGKPAEAEPFARASWRDSLRAEVGDHLGQIYEALSKKDEACAIYRLADAAADSKTPPEVRTHIRSSFSRLEATGVKPGPKNGTDALQKSRTYKIDHAASTTGWGTFRIELGADAVIEAQQMSGETAIAGVGEAIRKIKFPDLLPPGSKAHLLPSGVVSCSKISGCELVLVPGGGLQTERQ